MIWFINGEEYSFGSWEELGLSLRDLCRSECEIKVAVGQMCDDCNGEGTIVAFGSGGLPIHMECAECNATGIKP